MEIIQNINPRDRLEFFIQKAALDKSFCNSILIGHGNSYLPFIYKALMHFRIEPKLMLR